MKQKLYVVVVEYEKSFPDSRIFVDEDRARRWYEGALRSDGFGCHDNDIISIHEIDANQLERSPRNS